LANKRLIWWGTGAREFLKSLSIVSFGCIFFPSEIWMQNVRTCRTLFEEKEVRSMTYWANLMRCVYIRPNLDLTVPFCCAIFFTLARAFPISKM
jgi:hypothetical protein